MHVLDELQARGFIKQSSDPDGLRAAMDEGPVRYYAGFDPTGPSLHIGHLLPILMMWHLQQAGHVPIALFGGGTGMVGDPSGKTEARQLLAEQVIADNLARQRAQVGRFLTLDGARGLTVDNADWLLELQYIPFLRDIGSCFSVNRMLAAEGYKQRLERGLSFLEFNYQLLQAYDFLQLHQRHGVTLQIGGDDQWGNLVAGIDLVRRKAQHTVYAMTIPLLTTATGAKMGKTAKGAVWLDADMLPPFDFYQYWINVDDRDVGRFLKLYTTLPLEECERLGAMQGKDVRTAKAALAHAVTTLVHGMQAADEAQRAAKAMTSATASDDLPTYAVPPELLATTPAWFVIIAESGLAKSRGEARRLIKGGGVKLDGDKLSDGEAVVTADDLGADGIVLRVGKKRAARIVVG